MKSLIAHPAIRFFGENGHYLANMEIDKLVMTNYNKHIWYGEVCPLSVEWYIVLITLVAGVGGTGLGGLLGVALTRNSSKIVSLLLSFAGGIMMSVVCFDLVPSAFSPNGATEKMPLWLVIAGILLGYVIVAILNHWIDARTNPEVGKSGGDHPKTADDLDELIHADHYNAHVETRKNTGVDIGLFSAGVVMACAIALHNMPEGMVIGASYAGSFAQSGSLTVGAGFIIAIVIGLHNIPEGMAVSVPLAAGGMSKVKAVTITALSGLPTILGALLGYSLGMISPVWLSVSLSFASGAMVYVVLGELFPESFLMWKSKAPGGAALVGLLLGILLVNI